VFSLWRKELTLWSTVLAVMNGPEELDAFAVECAKELLVPNPKEFKYPDGCSDTNWPIDEIRSLNDSLLSGLRNNGNVYALYTKKSGEDGVWSPVYIGQRKSAYLRERISQHLITKSEQTGSMLGAVKNAVANGHMIAVSYIMVKPESLRLYVEEVIISKKIGSLSWNTHG